MTGHFSAESLLNPYEDTIYIIPWFFSTKDDLNIQSSQLIYFSLCMQTHTLRSLASFGLIYMSTYGVMTNYIHLPRLEHIQSNFTRVVPEVEISFPSKTLN